MAAKRGFEILAGRVPLVAIALEGSGFIAAAKRSVITFALAGLSRKTQLSVFGSLPEAATWTEARSETTGFLCPPSAELVKATRRVCEPAAASSLR
jgi:hypothetical protein